MSSLSSAFQAANRGPLTTIFTPPASCLSETTLVSFPTTPLANTSSTFTTTKIFINHFSWGDGNCYPSTIATFDGSTRWGNGYYYSPGVCPSGWTSACQISTNALGFSTSIGSQTSAVMCCPSNWDCVGGSTTLTAHGCSTALHAGEILSSVWLAPQPTPSITMDLPAKRNLTTWTVPKGTSAVCDGIPVLWQNSDLPILALLGVTATFSLATTTGTQSSNTIPANTNSSSATSSPTSSSLSNGAKVAIGVTIPVIIIALIVGIFLFFRRRNSRTSEHQHHELPTSADSNSGSWTHLRFLKSRLKHTAPNELDSARVFEADPGHQIVEIGESRGPVFEMADTSSIDGKKDTKVKGKIGTGRGTDVQRTEELHRVQSPGGDEIDASREHAPPSYTV